MGMVIILYSLNLLFKMFVVRQMGFQICFGASHDHSKTKRKDRYTILITI
jgi:hypothetical protein